MKDTSMNVWLPIWHSGARLTCIRILVRCAAEIVMLCLVRRSAVMRLDIRSISSDVGLHRDIAPSAAAAMTPTMTTLGPRVKQCSIT